MCTVYSTVLKIVFRGLDTDREAAVCTVCTVLLIARGLDRDLEGAVCTVQYRGTEVGTEYSKVMDNN